MLKALCKSHRNDLAAPGEMFFTIIIIGFFEKVYINEIRQLTESA